VLENRLNTLTKTEKRSEQGIPSTESQNFISHIDMYYNNNVTIYYTITSN